MEWLEGMNDAVEYLETHLAEDSPSLEAAARLAAASVYHFQRMFSHLAGVPLAEYLRRRRLTQAAFELQNGARVLDVALRYGYSSPTAFNRAFQALHGLPPSAAQKPGIALKAYPRIHFQITVEGANKMDYRIEKKDAFRIVGVREALTMDIEEGFERVPVFWQEVATKGLLPQILPLMGGEPKALLGVSTCYGEGAENYYYIAVASEQPAPEGMHEMQVPACTWAIFPGVGGPAEIQALQKRIVGEWLPASGYEWAQAPDIEVYLDEDVGNQRFEIWLPVVRK